MSRTPKTNRVYCPHCDSNNEPYFSRSVPMGFYCRDCGKDVDEKQSDQTMIIDEMTTTDKIEYYKKLLELERRTLASVTEQRDKLKRECDEYKDLLIRVYDDLFVHRNMGEAVRDLKILMGAIQLTEALSAMEGGTQ